MRKYIIVDSNNNWLATESNKKEAIAKIKELRKCFEEGGYFEDMEVGDELYLFKAEEIDIN